MRRNFIWALLIALSVVMSSNANADLVLFDFRDDDTSDPDLDPLVAFDGGSGGGGVGANATIDGLTLTTVDILAPEFVDDGMGSFMLSGTILSALAGENVTTNIAGNRDRIVVNNPSISNSQFDTITTAGVESSDFNSGESWVFNFDQAVVFDTIEFENLEAGNIYTISIDGGVSQAFDGPDGNVNGTDLGLLDGAVIAAGTSVTIAVSGPLIDNDGGIESFTVDTISVVPEPSSLMVLVGMAGIFAARRRRR